MSRRYDEKVHVVTTPRPLQEEPSGEAPSRFVWQGRLYTVREVLSSWQERQAWWKDIEPAQRPAELGGAASGQTLAVLADGADRRCWRVLASVGHRGTAGTFDLARLPERTVGGPGDSGAMEDQGAAQWRLMRVGD